MTNMKKIVTLFVVIVVAFSVIAKATQTVQKASIDVSEINVIIDKHHCGGLHAECGISSKCCPPYTCLADPDSPAFWGRCG
ncbi:unnamed protein product [Amaranthus hypochondriacus]